MHVMIMAQHYAPEEVSGAVLATELAEDLVSMGHQVIFVTCAPNYPSGKVFPGYKNAFFHKESLNGVEIIRIWSYISPSKKFFHRVLNMVTFSFMAFYGGLRCHRPDVLMSYSPPLPLGISAWFVGIIRGIPWVLRVEDLFPEAAVAAGLMRNKIVTRLFERLEQFLYNRADKISLISPGFQKNLLGKGIYSSKLSVAPVWADPAFIRPQEKENDFRKKHNLSGKFVIMYAGTLGYTSALEEVVEAAGYLAEDENIKFVIVGEGVKKNSLITHCQNMDANSVIFLPFQPRERFAEMMAAADISLVTLNQASANYSMPNKVFSIMASGRPILAVTPPESEVSELVAKWDCGVDVAVGNARVLADKIIELSQDPESLKRYGVNGRLALEESYSRENCIGLFEKTLTEAINDQKN